MLFCWPHARTRKDEQDSDGEEEEESHHQFALPPPPPVISIGRNNLNPRNPFSNCLPKKQDAAHQVEERKTPVPRAAPRAIGVEPPPPPPPPPPPGRAAAAAAAAAFESLEEEKDQAGPRARGATPVAAISTQSTMTTTNNSDSSSSTSPPSPLGLRDLDSTCAPSSGMSSTMSHMMDGNTSFGSTTEDDQISAGALTPSVSNCYYGGSIGGSSSIRSSSLAIQKTPSSIKNSDSWLLEEQEHEDSTRGGGDESSLGDSWEPIVPDLEDDDQVEAGDKAAEEPITPARAAYYESVAKKHQPLQPVTPPPSVILSHKMVISPPSPPPASPPEPYFNKPKSIPESTTLKPSARVQRFYKDVTPTKPASVKNSTKAFLVVFVAVLLFGVLGGAGFWDNALNLQQPQPLPMKKPAYASTKSTIKKSSHYNSTTAPTTTSSSSSSSFNVTEVQEVAMSYFSLPSFSSTAGEEEDEVVIDDSIFDLSPAQLADAATNGPFLLPKPSTTTRQRRRTRRSRISGRNNKAQEEVEEEELEEEVRRPSSSFFSSGSKGSGFGFPRPSFRNKNPKQQQHTEVVDKAWNDENPKNGELSVNQDHPGPTTNMVRLTKSSSSSTVSDDTVFVVPEQHDIEYWNEKLHLIQTIVDLHQNYGFNTNTNNAKPKRTIFDWVAERYQRLNVYVLGQSQLAQLKRKQFQFGQSSIGSLA